MDHTRSISFSTKARRPFTAYCNASVDLFSNNCRLFHIANCMLAQKSHLTTHCCAKYLHTVVAIKREQSLIMKNTNMDAFQLPNKTFIRCIYFEIIGMLTFGGS